ncbi:small subunit processome component 20 homolog [Teleopsis dalmanni]|uniref:small subunit processome component 20 homolog n=1 Tax=Teleopsis dalmanni TaxID=139649 RepID=UPI0018CD75EB|nr:small subunit processome component 20 homolog [Teleopsis dalmanni]
MKVCTFLRSPLKSVRRFTLDNLKKIMKSLGSSYLALLMDHLQTLLTRGFQIHVLSVTVHGVLDELREILQAGDIDRCLGNVLEVAMNDIFGEAAVEKSIDKITAHTPEAKPSAKSYLILHIVARNIQETCLLDLLLPFRDHLTRSQSRKVTMKIQDCFAKIVAGLVENAHITCQSLLYFVYGTISESITDLLPGTQKRVLSDQEKEKMRRARPDCYIIQPAPRTRSGAVNKIVKSNAQANAHILIEFGLEMLYIVLKRKKLMSVNYQPFLHPLLPLLRDSLKSTHIRCTTFALKCFASIWNEEYELPALQEHITDIVTRMFEILKNFSTFGATKQEDNFQLVKSSFKAIVALLRKYTEYELTEEQITQLVLYIEQDLYEGENQAMCLPLLKALVTRKVDSKALHELMKKIGDLSIVSQSDFVRNETRAILFIYLMEYKLKHRVDQVIKFMSAQLCYSLPTGRQSVIKFFHTVIQKFPHKILAKRAEFLFLTLGLRLVNDDEPDCRRAVAECIELLINRLDKVNRQLLFDIILLLMESNDKATTREMGACLCSRFVNVEKQSFSPRLKTILSSIQARITLNNPNAPGRFVRAPGVLGVDVHAEDVMQNHKNKGRRRELYEKMDHLIGNEEALAETVEEKQRAIDHEVIQMQYCLLKIFDYCGQTCFSNEELVNIVDELAYESQRLLAHEHSLVRCNAAKILTHVLGNYDFDLVAQIINKEKTLESINPQSAKLNYIYINPELDIKSLTLDLCAQITPGDTAQEMIDEIVKIFLYIGNMLRNVSLANVEIKINLHWFARRIRFLINKEVARAPHSTQIRTALFTLIEGFITLLSVETIEILLPTLLPTLVREMSEDDDSVDLKLRQLALHVGSRLRKRIGSDLYDKLRTNVQTELMMRRAERKKVIAQEKIHDPVRAAKRKVGIQERKKAAKKRKTELMRGKVEDVKQKLKKRKRKAEDDLF